MSNAINRPVWRAAVAALAVSLALGGCGNKNEEREKQIAAQSKSAVPTVSVLTVYPENVLIEHELTGRLESVRSTDIVPQVSAVVKRRLFQEGTYVRAGQPLFELDSAAYQAGLQSAHAGLASAEAALAKANADLARYRPLVEADAISKQEWDAAVTAKRAAEAQIMSAQAAIRSAQVSIGYTRIVAPISGFIGQSFVSEGALVSPAAGKLATITETDPMYVNISQSAGEIMKINNQLASGERKLNGAMQVEVELEDGTQYPHKGRLLFRNQTVDAATGQVLLRAAVPNPEGLLMSGLFVRVKLPITGVENAFVVPQQAVTRGESDTLMIVNAVGKMEPRTVKVAGQKGSSLIITEGLNPGDKVVMEGSMIAGMLRAEKVETKEWQADGSAAAAPEQAASAPAEQASAPASAAQ